MALENIKIGCSPLSGNIYAGYVRGNTWTKQVDRTKEVLSAAIEHWMLDAGEKGVVVEGTGPNGKIRLTIEYTDEGA